MCVVFDEAVRPDWLVAAPDDVHSCRMELVVEGEPDLARAVRKHLAADDAGPSVRAVVKVNEVAPTRLRMVFRNVDPATAKQIADEYGGTSALRLLRSTCCRRSRARSGRCR